jgi:hypothetical protein
MDVLIGNLAVEAGAGKYVSDKLTIVSCPFSAVTGKSYRHAS